jgi:hypothetical protein
MKKIILSTIAENSLFYFSMLCLLFDRIQYAKILFIFGLFTMIIFIYQNILYFYFEQDSVDWKKHCSERSDTKYDLFLTKYKWLFKIIRNRYMFLMIYFIILPLIFFLVLKSEKSFYMGVALIICVLFFQLSFSKLLRYFFIDKT